MAWYDPRDWDDYASDAYGYVKNKLNSPMRGEGQYAGVDRGSFDLPGYGQFAQSTQQFAGSRGGGPFRGGQERLAGQLERLASGQDSYSREQLRQQTGRLQAMQQSMAAGASPSSAALAQRLAMQNAGNVGAQMSGQAALAGIAERQAAAQALGGVLGQGRGQDIQSYLGGTELGLRAAGLQQQGGMGYEEQRTRRALGAMGAPGTKEALIGALSGFGQSLMGIPGGLGGGGGGGSPMPASYWNTFSGGGGGAGGPGGGAYY